MCIYIHVYIHILYITLWTIICTCMWISIRLHLNEHDVVVTGLSHNRCHCKTYLHCWVVHSQRLQGVPWPRSLFKGQIKDDCRLVQKTYSGTLDIPLMMMMMTTTTMTMMIWLNLTTECPRKDGRITSCWSGISGSVSSIYILWPQYQSWYNNGALYWVPPYILRPEILGWY